MFRSASRSFLSCTRNLRTARNFHRATADFIDHDASGNLASRKVPVIIGNPGQAYVLIETWVGNALRAASPFASPSAAIAEDRCKVTFFHDEKHFGFG